MSEKNLINIKEALEQLFEKNKKLKKNITEARIKNTWSELMQETIMPYTAEIKFRSGILSIKLTSAALREELNRGKSTLIQNLNNALGEEIVQDIRFI